MGREAICSIRWQGEAAEGKALLESEEVILRGDIRARIPRAEITRAEVEGEVLRLLAAGGWLELDLGAKAAESWRKAILKGPPSLAEKLGVGPGARAFALAPLTDEAVIAALSGAEAAQAADAAFLIAELLSDAGLAAALAAAEASGAPPIWCLYPKGKTAEPSDARVREVFRAAGFVDVKSCAVSDRLTATRYQRRRD
ncbi:hypothetical protein OU426_02590 [Frigidibacter sp. RF13]|uniref:hypothetical protein n=1 Tax=Frigidibacter sp. RF13 TaxID=2997340 RepID=UPI00226E3478|nr:hypothetical protein [Frigidibacter sp. RF13]MCY1125731.1 hypothetical protein [Frigidibacter sp. RF13]